MTVVGPDRKPLTLGEKLDILPGIAAIALVAIYSTITAPFRSKKDAPTLFLHIAYAILRKSTLRLSPKQLQLIQPHSDLVYDRYARSVGFTADTVELAHGSKGHWVGDKTSKNVLIWFHGGGFCLPSNLGYFKFFTRVIKSAKAAGKDLAVFAITYDLAPAAIYPTQLTQCVEGVRYILGTGKWKPSHVFLGGDSAGGNLAVGVLSHLAHPHPQIKKIAIKEELGGTALIAPWAWLDEEQSRIPRYSGGDIVSPPISLRWIRSYLGGQQRDNYTDPMDAPGSWFETFPVQKVLVLGGEHEVLLPLIEQFTDKLREGLPDTELFVGPGEAHVAPVYNILVGDNTETQQGRKLKIWLNELLH